MNLSQANHSRPSDGSRFIFLPTTSTPVCFQRRHPSCIAAQIISAVRPSCSLVPSDRAIAGQSSPSKCWSAWSSKGGEQEELEKKQGFHQVCTQIHAFPIN